MERGQGTKQGDGGAGQPDDWRQINENLRRVEDAIWQVGEAVRKRSESDANPAEAGQAREAAKRAREALTGIVMDTTRTIANAELRAIAESRSDERDYEEKKRIARHVNEMLRQQGAVIAHPDTGEPCLVLAVGSPDGKGRYVLDSRETGKRSRTSMALMDLLPITPMPDTPRREAFLERRKQGSPQSGHGPEGWRKHLSPPAEPDQGKSR